MPRLSNVQLNNNPRVEHSNWYFKKVFMQFNLAARIEIIDITIWNFAEMIIYFANA